MNTEWSRPTKYIVAVGIVILGFYILYLARPVISLLVIATLIAVIVRPLILWLHERVRLPRGLAVIVVYLGLVILAPLGLLLAIPLILDAVGYVIGLDYQIVFQNILNWLRETLQTVRDMQLLLPALDNYVDQTVEGLLTQLEQAAEAPVAEPPPVEMILRSLGTALTATFGAATSLVGVVVTQITLLIFILLASIYINMSAHTFRETFLSLAPPAYRPEIAVLMARIEKIWLAFFQGQLTLMLVIGLMTWLGLSILGMPGAISLAIIAGLLELIPSLGPFIALVPAVIVALLQGSVYLPISNLAFAGMVIALYLLIQQLENNLIVPRVLGGAVELSPLVVIIGVLTGASVAGILGIFLATPVIATGREILRYVYLKLQGKEPIPPEEVLPEPGQGTFMRVHQRLSAWVSRLSLPQFLTSRHDKSGSAVDYGNEPDGEDSLQEEQEDVRVEDEPG